ncbi:MAG: FKBP-type peptidyl-prolyl cis-trans isomerase, partial [bacterium]
LLDGTIFDQTTGNQTATFPLANLIPGWQEGIPLLQKGGKGTFLLPSALGYGPNPVGPIPANSVLIFEIELIDF